MTTGRRNGEADLPAAFFTLAWALAGALLVRPAGGQLLQLNLDGSLEGRAGGEAIAGRLGPGAKFIPSAEGQGAAPGATGPAVTIPVPDDLWRPCGTIAFRFQPSGPVRYDPSRDKSHTVTLLDSPVLRAVLTERYNLTVLDIAAAASEKAPASRGQMFLSHLKAGQWYHLAIAWDARTGLLEAYLDGQLQQNLRRRGVEGGWRPVKNPTGPLALGGAWGGGPSAVRFAVDSVRLYSSALNEQAIARRLRGRPVKPLEGEGRTDYEGSLDLTPFRRTLLWEADFSKPLNVVHEDQLFDGPKRTRLPIGKDWVLEGSGRAWTEAGRLHVETTGEEGGGHLVLWNTRVFPENLLIEWEMAPEDPNTGLAILFFAARPKDNPQGGIFDLNLPKRYGLFKNYHSGALNSYHCSYWAPPRRTANLRKNYGFLLASCGIDRIAGQGPGPHKVRLLKYGGEIRLESRGRLALVYNDDGRSYGPVWTDGYIGLRQMAHTRRMTYTSFKVWKLER